MSPERFVKGESERTLLMQLSLRASHPRNSSQNPEFWTQLDADSDRSGHLGRDDSGIFHFSDYGVYQNLALSIQYLETTNCSDRTMCRIPDRIEKHGNSG